jgi:hypothetical protein
MVPSIIVPLSTTSLPLMFDTRGKGTCGNDHHFLANELVVQYSSTSSPFPIINFKASR